MNQQRKLSIIYSKLLACFGEQKWWPADDAFEVMLGAILTQNTSWLNVEKAIANIKKHRLLHPRKMDKIPLAKLAKLIRPAGYYNVKAKRIKYFLRFLSGYCRMNIAEMSKKDVLTLRQDLLKVNGIGQETADSILLYALNKPVFVVDAYTKRILACHKLAKEDSTYEDIQRIFMQNLKSNVKLFNEYHALLVRLGKDYCLKNKPKCSLCPLKQLKEK